MKNNGKNEEVDWFDGLTEEQQQGVLRGLEQADRGEGMPHEEAMIRLGLIDPPNPENSKR